MSLAPVAGALEGKASAPIKVVPSWMKPLGFSRVLLRPDGTYEIALAEYEFDVLIIETLRKQGHNIVGAENLVIGVDKGYKAEMLLGATITELSCASDPLVDIRRCGIAIKWQLYDLHKDAVVYEVTTRDYKRLRHGERISEMHAKLMVKRALGSLMSRTQFVDTLRKGVAPNSGENRYERATFKTCRASERRLPDDIGAIKKALVLIRLGTGHATGFFFSEDGLIMTAQHVVSDAKTVKVKTYTGETLEATVLRSSKEDDVAILRIPGSGYPCIPLEMTLPSEGGAAYAAETLSAKSWRSPLLRASSVRCALLIKSL